LKRRVAKLFGSADLLYGPVIRLLVETASRFGFLYIGRISTFRNFTVPEPYCNPNEVRIAEGRVHPHRGMRPRRI
jgi:hypothetical protein